MSRTISIVIHIQPTLGFDNCQQALIKETSLLFRLSYAQEWGETLMQYVFETTDGDGCIRCHVAEVMRREADMLIVRRKGLESAILISSITDWCAVDEADDDAPMPLDMTQMAA